MTRIHPFEFALALVLAGAVHGAALVSLAVRAPEPPEETAEPLVFLELAALDTEAGPLDPTAPSAALAPEMPDLPANLVPDLVPPAPLPLPRPDKAVPPPAPDAPDRQPPPDPERLPEAEPPLPETAPPPPPPELARADPELAEPPPPELETAALEPPPPPVEAPRRPPERTAEPAPQPRMEVAAVTPPPPPETRAPLPETLPRLERPAPPRAAEPPRPASEPADRAVTPPPEPRPQVASAPAIVPPQAVAPARRQDGRNADAIAAYAKDLYTLINTAAGRAYPRQAAQRGEQGIVPVRLTVGAGGELLSVAVADETGASGRLVRAALQAVERAAPFPAFAPVMQNESETFEVSIVYKLR